MTEWRLNIEKWPGPDRTRWRDFRDIVRPAPGGRHVAVVYSCHEVGVCKEVGLFALLSGPKESPQLLLRPRGFMCCIFFDDNLTVRWIGSRYCAVSPFHQALNGSMYFDVSERKVAFFASSCQDQSESDLPIGLKWSGWRWLALGPNAFRHFLVLQSICSRPRDSIRQ